MRQSVKELFLSEDMSIGRLIGLSEGPKTFAFFVFVAYYSAPDAI